MLTAIGDVSFKEIVAYTSFVFMAGGVWRDIRSVRRTQERHSKYLANDRDVLLKITTEHNQNHKSNIQIPQANGTPG